MTAATAVPGLSPARRVLRALAAAPKFLLLGALRFYQLYVSPMRPPTCRFYPSCSQYAVIAVTRHGALRGSWLAARRLLRCHPWNPGGVDDVPPAGAGRRHHHVAPATR